MYLSCLVREHQAYFTLAVKVSTADALPSAYIHEILTGLINIYFSLIFAKKTLNHHPQKLCGE